MDKYIKTVSDGDSRSVKVYYYGQTITVPFNEFRKILTEGIDLVTKVIKEPKAKQIQVEY